eukprot:4116892-Pyramimonas_sp.AAC.1
MCIRDSISCACAWRLKARRSSPGSCGELGDLGRDLVHDLGDDAGADGAAALAEGEAEAGLHGNGLDKFEFAGDVVAGHHHLRALGELDAAGNVRRAEVELSRERHRTAQ